jgi:hypothetical protein
MDEVKSVKAKNKSEARNYEEELAALLDEIRVLPEAKESNL